MDVKIPGAPKCLHLKCYSQWLTHPSVGVVVRVVCCSCGREVSGELKARIEFFVSKRGKDMVRCVCENGQIFQVHAEKMEQPKP